MGILTQPVAGWRRYNVVNPGFLESANNIIVPRQRAESWCKKCKVAPAPDCTCGFYAFKSLELFLASDYAGQGVFAEVYMWGTVHVFRDGYRAQYTYPAELLVHGDMAESMMHRLRMEYGVPVSKLPAKLAKRMKALQEERLAKYTKRWLTEKELYERVKMGDAQAVTTLRNRLSSAISTRRKALVRLEKQYEATAADLKKKLAQRDALNRAR